MERGTSRDLYDLWLLAEADRIPAQAAELFRRHGPTGEPPRPWAFRNPPSTESWSAQLAAQTRLRIGPSDALRG